MCVSVSLSVCVCGVCLYLGGAKYLYSRQSVGVGMLT